MEEWKPIKGFEGLYEVSSHGRVKSLPKCWKMQKIERCLPETIMRQQKHYRGYLYVFLSSTTFGKQKHFVHRLVASAFLPNPDLLPMVNHLDRNKEHNCAFGCHLCINGNLQWSTYSDNTIHYRAIEAAAAEGSDIPF